MKVLSLETIKLKGNRNLLVVKTDVTYLKLIKLESGLRESAKLQRKPKPHKEYYQLIARIISPKGLERDVPASISFVNPLDGPGSIVFNEAEVGSIEIDSTIDLIGFEIRKTI